MDYLTVQEVAKRLAVLPKRIYALLQRGDFPNARQFGRTWMVPVGDVDQMIADRLSPRPSGLVGRPPNRPAVD